MATGTPFDFTILNSGDSEEIVRKLEDSIDTKLMADVLEQLSGTPASVVCATLCAALSSVVATICSTTPESTACEVHHVLARFSHAVLHSIVRVHHSKGTYTGALDMEPPNHHQEPLTKH